MQERLLLHKEASIIGSTSPSLLPTITHYSPNQITRKSAKKYQEFCHSIVAIPFLRAYALVKKILTKKGI